MAKSKKPKKTAKAKKPAAAKKPTAKVSKTAKTKKSAKAKTPTKPVAPKAKGKKPPVKKSSKAPKGSKKAVTTKTAGIRLMDDPGTGGGDIQPLATPNISSPTTPSTQTPGQNLAVSATTNNTMVRYRYELTDVTGMPPYPTPFVWDVTPVPPATAINTSVPAAQLQANKTYTLKVSVHPDDAGGLAHSSHSVTFSTGP